MTRPTFSIVPVAALMMCLFGVVPAPADTISIGFEPGEGYSPGSVHDQPTTPPKWSKAGPYDVEVSAGGARTGSQSLRISNAVTSGSFGDQAFSPPLTDMAGELGAISGGLAGGTRQDRFSSQWYFRPVVISLQDGLGVTVSADRGDGARMTYVRMRDTASVGLGLDFWDYGDLGGAATDDLGIPADPNGRGFRYSLLATGLARDHWHRVDMIIDFFDGENNDVVRVLLDGALVKTGNTWEDYFRINQNPPFTDAPPVDSLLIRVAGTAVPSLLGNGLYIDDLTYSSTSVPEPASLLLVGPGLAGLAVVTWRRRRRQ